MRENVRVTQSADEAKDYQAAATWMEEKFMAADIAQMSPQKWIHLLQTVHTQATKTLFTQIQSSAPGTFRTADLWVLRNPLSNAGYHTAFQPLAMAKFLSQSKDPACHGATPQHILIAYHKYFYVGSPNKQMREREPGSRAATQKIAKSEFKITITDKMLKSADFTPEEEKTFNLFYKQYPPSEQLTTLLETLFTEMQVMAKQGQPLIEIASYFFYKFLLIKPFQDGNGRMARLIANALIYKATGLVVNLNTLASRLIFEHHFNLDPDPKKIAKHFEDLIDAQQVTKDKLHAALGKQFLDKYAEKIKWQVDEKTKTATLTLGFPSSYQPWFTKKLGSIPHTFIDHPSGKALVQLVVHQISVASFRGQTPDDRLSAAALAVGGLSALSLSNSSAGVEASSSSPPEAKPAPLNK